MYKANMDGARPVVSKLDCIIATYRLSLRPAPSHPYAEAAMASSPTICAHYSAPSIRPALLVHLARSLRNYSIPRPTNDHRPKNENFALRDERGEEQ